MALFQKVVTESLGVKERTLEGRRADIGVMVLKVLLSPIWVAQAKVTSWWRQTIKLRGE